MTISEDPSTRPRGAGTGTAWNDAPCAAEAVVERVRMPVGQWVGGRSHDDMAVVAITAPRTAHLSTVDGHTRGGYTV